MMKVRKDQEVSNSNKGIFSVPLNPKLNEKQFFEFIDFLQRNKDYIYDVYFTSRISPFDIDAMGDTFTNNEALLKNALYIQSLGFKISAVYNNINISPSQENLDTFISNFKPLYKQGVRSATIPFTHWLLSKQIQNEFPDLYIKNTILNNVSEPREIANLADAGFNYINLDRVLMRDEDRLKKLKKVADIKGVKLSLLANEGCKGGCSVMNEHFSYNNNRQGSNDIIDDNSDVPYFANEISRTSCPHWDNIDPSIPLKTANFTPWKDDWIDLLQYVDVFKMHGRESIQRLYETMTIVDNFRNDVKYMFNAFDDFAKGINPKTFDFWRKKIKNCKFDCWDCNSCDQLFKTFKKEINKTNESLSQILLDIYLIEYKGLDNDSPIQVQKLVNEITKINNNTYIEINEHEEYGTLDAVIKNDVDMVVIGEKFKPNTIKELKQKYVASSDILLYNNSYQNFNPGYIPDAGVLNINVNNIDSLMGYLDTLNDIVKHNTILILRNSNNTLMVEEFENTYTFEYKKTMIGKSYGNGLTIYRGIKHGI